MVPRLKLLIVDDDKLILRIITETLGKDFEFAQFTTADEAYDYLTENEVNLLLTDYRLEDSDSLALIQKAKEIKPHLKVLVMSGSVGVQAALSKGLVDGLVDGFLEKPFQLEILRETIKELTKCYS